MTTITTSRVERSFSPSLTLYSRALSDVLKNFCGVVLDVATWRDTFVPQLETALSGDAYLRDFWIFVGGHHLAVMRKTGANSAQWARIVEHTAPASGILLPTLGAVKAEVKIARSEALDEARALNEGGFLPSRGTFLATSDAQGQCRPAIEADCPTWRGTWQEIFALIALATKDYPNVTEIYVAGGYDWAATQRAYDDGDYQPWAASWHVPVWRPESRS